MFDHNKKSDFHRKLVPMSAAVAVVNLDFVGGRNMEAFEVADLKKP